MKNKSLSLSLSLSLSNHYYRAFFLSRDSRCNHNGTINDPFSDRGFGQRSSSSVNYGVERFGKFMFYLKPQNQL
jgi:hypothetical protein